MLHPLSSAKDFAKTRRIKKEIVESHDDAVRVVLVGGDGVRMCSGWSRPGYLEDE